MKVLKKSIVFVVMIAMILSSVACSGKSESKPEEPEVESVIEKEEVKEEEKEPEEPAKEEIRIDVSWDGTNDNGEQMTMFAEFSDLEDEEKSVSAESSAGSLTLELDDLEGTYDFHVMVNDEPDFDGKIFKSGLSLEVYLPGESEPETYDFDPEGEDVYTSYTGTWLWGPFGISEGKISEYDSSWMEVSSAGLCSDIENGFIFGTLIGTADADMDAYVEEVKVDNGFLVITGSFKGGPEEENLYSNPTSVYEYGTYKFLIPDDAVFYAAGGTSGDLEISLDEFIELAQYYNGLGMILEIRDKILVGGKITS